MKTSINLISTLILVFIFNSSFGQSINTAKTVKKIKSNQANLIKKILKKQSINSHNAKAKTTEIAERLTGISDYIVTDTSNNLRDTARFTYSLSRNSIFNYNTIAYDNSYNVNGISPMGFGGEIGFPDHNSAPDIQSDSTQAWLWDTSSMSLYLDDLRISAYDSNYNVTDYKDLYQNDTTAYYADDRYINTFDAYGNIATSMDMNWNSGVWDTSEFRMFFYDMSHTHVIKDSTNSYATGSWVPEEKWLYTYNDSGFMTRGDYYLYNGVTWQETQIYFLTYYPDNRIKTDSVVFDTGSAWITVVKDTFGYTPGISYATFVKDFIYDFGINIAYTVSTKNISGLSLPDTLFGSTYAPNDSLMQRAKVAYKYDSYGEPILSILYTFYITNDSIGDGYYDTIDLGYTHYYYETYEESPIHHHTGIAATPPSNTETITIYPNPTTNTLSISRPGAAWGAYTYIELINACGQVVHSEGLSWLQATQTLSMAGLAPGAYWLVLQDKGGNTVCWREVVKE